MAQPHTSSPGTETSMATARRVHVQLPLPLPPYDYAVPDDLALAPGDIVQVPLGRRQVAGVVWGEGPADAGNAPAARRLRPVTATLPAPAMPEGTRRFLDWVAAYTCSARGAVLRMALNVPAALEAPRVRTAYRLTGLAPERMTDARRRVIEALADGPARTAADLAEAAGVSSGVVQGLAATGTLEPVPIVERFEPPVPDPEFDRLALSPAQQAAAAALRRTVAGGGYASTLLDGVTGSGKTEVYFEAIAQALRATGEVLVLVPEIALTEAWLARFEARFGAPPVVWHSELSQRERRLTWRAVAEGRVRVVVGARSALFLPFTDLRLVVVDEEHDTAFKQDDGVAYHARDMGVARASLAGFPIVLVSATPSLESLANVEAGRYAALHLPERIGAAELPDVIAVDLRETPPERGRWLSPPLDRALQETLAAGEQSLIFLNRRGYAPLTLCRTCGHRLQCPDCTAWLVEHRFRRSLQCHHCGYGMALPETCPNCGDAESFVACGPGVERVFEEIGERYPGARTLVVSSDTVYGPGAAAEVVRTIRERQVDVIVGTQMIAKGHHFPYLTLVGVVDADLGLAGGDLRAAERTYQLLAQVSGRAGRAERPGRALLQTWDPSHPVMAALVGGDRAAFLRQEAEARRQQGMPPYGRLVALIVSGPNENAVLETARALARRGPHGPGIQVLGPAPAPLALLRGRHRHRLLLKTPRNLNASRLTAEWLERVSVPNSVRVAVDVDPYSFV